MQCLSSYTFVVILFLSDSSACSLWAERPSIVCSRERRSNLILWVNFWNHENANTNTKIRLIFYDKIPSWKSHVLGYLNGGFKDPGFQCDFNVISIGTNLFFFIRKNVCIYYYEIVDKDIFYIVIETWWCFHCICLYGEKRKHSGLRLSLSIYIYLCR